jgi:hypothetical protein
MIAKGHMRMRIESVGRKAMVIGLLAAAMSVALAFSQDNFDRFFQSYLQTFVMVFGLAGGSLILLMVHHVAGGRWGFITRGIMEAGIKTLPFTALLFVPILFGMDQIYIKWMDPEAAVAKGILSGKLIEVIEGKSWYLSSGKFMVRSLIYFLSFYLMGSYLTRWSQRQSDTGDETLNKPMRVLSGLGIVGYIMLMTMASWDWTMSLEPAWFSSMWGPLFFVGQALSTFCFMIIILHWLAQAEPLSGLVKPRHYHDLGNYCFAGIVLWTYMSFSQFTIIWHGNLGEEIAWYLDRSSPGWQYLAIFLVLFHFVVPFLLLLSRFAKLKGSFLVKVVVFILIVRFVDTFWVVGPTFSPDSAYPHLLDLLLPFALGGLWVSVYMRYLKNTPLLAKHDLRFQSDFNESSNHG